MIKTEPQIVSTGNDHHVGFRENVGTEVAGMDESYGEQGYDEDYAVYEGEYGQGYVGLEQYEGAGLKGKYLNLLKICSGASISFFPL